MHTPSLTATAGPGKTRRDKIDQLPPDWSQGLVIRQAGNGGWIVEKPSCHGLSGRTIAALTDEASLLSTLPAILAGGVSE